MSVVDDKGEPVFLHTIQKGGASHSFGVAVAKLAGIPEEVIVRSKELLEELEKRGTYAASEDAEYFQQVDLADHVLHKELEQLDISQMTPLEALNKLADLKEKLKLYSSSNRKELKAD